MKKFSPILLSMCILFGDPSGALASENHLPKPLIVLVEWNPWLQIGGVKDPLDNFLHKGPTTTFAMYDTGKIIFLDPTSDSYYSYIILHNVEFQKTVENLTPPESFYLLEFFYQLSDASHDELQEVYVHLKEYPKKIGIYGQIGHCDIPKDAKIVTETIYKTLQQACSSQNKLSEIVKDVFIENLERKRPLDIVTICGREFKFSTIRTFIRYIRELEWYYKMRRRCPKELLQLFDTLQGFQAPHSSEWFPEKIEVIVYCLEEFEGKITDWPEKWPDITHFSSKRHNENTYSLFLDPGEWKSLKDFLFSLEGMITMNQKTWTASVRFPLPEEESWESDWQEYLLKLK